LKEDAPQTHFGLGPHLLQLAVFFRRPIVGEHCPGLLQTANPERR
jgi:hypothetical protein